MSLVVSDTSPLTSLAAIGRLDLLHRLFGRIQIAESVWWELNAGGGHWPGRNEVADADWIVRHGPTNLALLTALNRDLDAGEAASIALALELSAELILIDELDGRHQARRQGLTTMGVAGVLLLAKRRGLIGTVKPLLDDLRLRARFWLSQSVYDQVLSEAQESP
jgi:hypothetical protein